MNLKRNYRNNSNMNSVKHRSLIGGYFCLYKVCRRRNRLSAKIEKLFRVQNLGAWEGSENLFGVTEICIETKL